MENLMTVRYKWKKNTLTLKGPESFHKKLQTDHTYTAHCLNNLLEQEKAKNTATKVENSDDENQDISDSVDQVPDHVDEEMDYSDESKSMSHTNADVGHEQPSSPDQPELRQWDYSSIKLLLAEYRKRLEYFRNPQKYRKIDLWRDIADEFAKKGKCVQAESVHRKFRNMKNHYQTVRKNLKRPSTSGRMKWAWYKSMDELVGPDIPIISNNSDENHASLEQNTSNDCMENLALPSTSNNDVNLDSPLSTQNVDIFVEDKNYSDDCIEQLEIEENVIDEKPCESDKRLEMEMIKVDILRELNDNIKEFKLSQKENSNVLREGLDNLTTAMNASTAVLTRLANFLEVKLARDEYEGKSTLI